MSGSIRAPAPNPNPQSTPNDGAPIAGIAAATSDDLRPERGKPDSATMLPRIIGWYKASRDHWQQQRQEMAEMFDLRAGHQWSDEDLEILADQTRPAITFNRVGPFLDAVGGMEINNRQDVVFLPRQLGSSGKSDLLTSAASWVRQECDAEDEESEMFLDAVTCGWGWSQTRMDFDENPDGITVIERVDPLEMFPDANARKQNLTDRRHHLRVKDVPVGAAEELFPGVDPYMLHAQWAEDEPDATRQPHNARLAPYYRIDQSGDTDRTEQMVRLVEVEWFDFVPAWRVLDPMTGRWVLLDEAKASLYMLRARQLGQHPRVIKDRAKKYWKAIVGAEILTIVDGPKSGGFQYKCMTGKRDATRGTWYGIVRAMKDPQLWANKWLSQGLHIFNTNAKGGLLAETDAFADIDEARDAFAEADSIIELNPGGLNKVQPKQPAQFPPQLNEMMAFAISALPQVSGINVEMLGQSGSTSPQVALLEAGRRQQGMNVLAGLFNAKRRYHKEQGRLLLWMIQEYIADGRLIRIGGPEDAQYVPLIHEPGTAEYDVIVDDAPTSPNMKDKVWNSLMQLFPMLRGMPVPPKFYANALKYAPVPQSFVTESQQILEAPPPANPAMQAQQQIAQAKAQSMGADAARKAADAERIKMETALMPQSLPLDIEKKKADIELTRAQAVNALQDAGITADDARFQQTMAAIDAMLRVHGAALAHAQAVNAANAGASDEGPTQTTAPVQSTNAAPESAPPPENLREGHITQFANGQSWLLHHGAPVRVQ